MNTADHVDRLAARAPDRIGLVDEGGRLTWAEVAARSRRLAAALVGLGLPRDAAVYEQLPASIELYLLRLACERAGLRLVTVPPAFRQAEMTRLVAATRPAVAVEIVFPPSFRIPSGRPSFVKYPPFTAATAFVRPAIALVFSSPFSAAANASFAVAGSQSSTPTDCLAPYRSAKWRNLQTTPSPTSSSRHPSAGACTRTRKRTFAIEIMRMHYTRWVFVPGGFVRRRRRGTRDGWASGLSLRHGTWVGRRDS